MNKREMSGSDTEAAAGKPVTSLTGVETEVMGAVWDIGRPVRNMEVAEALLYRRRGRGLEPIPFPTVDTTLLRLAGKGVLRAVGKPGDPSTFSKREARAPYYEALLTREETAARMLDNVSRMLLGGPLAALIPRLTGRGSAGRGSAGGMSADGQERLRRLAEALEAAGAEEHDTPSDTDDAAGGPGDAPEA